MNTEKSTLRRLLFALCLTMPALCTADDYPSRPIKLVVPYAAGGNLDAQARILGDKLQQILKQPFVVENRAGASGAIGSQYVAASAPDGYTLMANSKASLVFVPLTVSSVKYRMGDFASLGTFSRAPLVIVVRDRNQLPNFEALLTHAKANAGQLAYGSPGTGTANHITAELIQAATGTHWNHIVYKGMAPATTDLLGGQIHLLVDQPGGTMSLIKAGKVHPVAVTSRTRFGLLPEVPTLIEKGVNVDEITWLGLFGPAGMPPSLMRRINEALNEALGDAEVQRKFLELGAETWPQTPSAAQALLEREQERAKQHIKAFKLPVN